MGPLLSAGLHPAHNNEHEDKPGPRPAGPTLGIAAVIGVPAGVAAGRWAWSSFASSVGAVPVSVVPVAALSIGFLALLAAGNLLALLPAAVAARTPPATALRAQ